jgi:hypothetical protein
MKIFWYGHSRYRIETGSSAIHIDPFSERRSHVHLPGLDPNADKFVAERCRDEGRGRGGAQGRPGDYGLGIRRDAISGRP